jgi:uncharacterized membrane protein YhiD involved in acid resistance
MHVDEFQIIWRLGLTLVLSSAIGVEREIAQKSAGLRTCSLVGVGSALFMRVSIFGFADGFGLPVRRSILPAWRPRSSRESDSSAAASSSSAATR